MYKISILFDNREFEHDIYELIRAFYPEAEIAVSYEEEDGANTADLLFRVEKQEQSFIIRYQNESNTGVTSAEIIKGHSSDDAPLSCTEEKDAARQQRKEQKDVLKYSLYKLLTKLTGKTLPWGNLTGIRPAKLAMAMIEAGMKNSEIAEEMRKRYLVSPEKTALAITIANREREILKDIDYENGYSLYVGIPFCPSICAYCSFSSYPLSVWEKQVDNYLDALCKEIEAASTMMGNKKLLTFYMGGGTPTSLSAAQMDRLLTCLEQYFDLAHVSEKTVEAGRPDSITEDKLKVLRKHHIDRISINPQTMNQETLDLIGRRHTTEEVKQAFHMAREAGFMNINMDLIAGLPGETSEHMQRTMDAIVDLAPDSVTVHSLALKRAAFLNQNREQFPVAGADEVNRMIGISHEGALAIEAEPYYLYRQKNIAGNLENVGYARKGCEGLYNILIMEEKQTILALGAGASSKFVFHNEHGHRIERVENVKSVKDYIERIDEMIDRKKNFLLKSENSF